MEPVQKKYIAANVAAVAVAFSLAAGAVFFMRVGAELDRGKRDGVAISAPAAAPAFPAAKGKKFAFSRLARD